MKKNTFFLTALLAVTLAFGLVFVGCDTGNNTDDGNGNEPPFVDPNGGGGIGTKVEDASTVPLELRLSSSSYGEYKKAGNMHFRTTPNPNHNPSGGTDLYIQQASSDGENWTDLVYSAPLIANNITLDRIVYTGSAYVTNNGHFSTDGITWQRPGTLSFSTKVAAGTVAADDDAEDRNYVMMVGTRSGETGIFWSHSGTNWTAITGGGFGSDDDLKDVAFGGGKFVACGIANGKANIAYATRQYNWTAATGEGINFNVSEGSGWRSLSYLGNMFFASGDDSRRAYSTDGATWTMWSGLIPTHFGDGKYVYYGNNVTGTGPTRIETEGIWYSSDLTTWKFEQVDRDLFTVGTFPGSNTPMRGTPRLLGFANGKFYMVVDKATDTGGMTVSHYVTVDASDLK